VDAYPSVHEYFRMSQVPLPAIWGKGGPNFIPPSAEASKRDHSNAVVKYVDAGHLARQIKALGIAKEMLALTEGVQSKE
jgi:hypothetical protein